MWFLGTANNDDSTFAISDKVYDRTMIVDLESKAEEFEAASCRTMPVTAEKFMEVAGEAMANSAVSEENSVRVKKLDEYLGSQFKVSFGNRIMRQIKRYLPVYVACGGTETEALDDILSKKVLRKLEMQNLAYRRGEAEQCISCVRAMARIG